MRTGRSHPLSLQLTRYAAARQPRHADPGLQISLVLRGRLVERAGGGEERAGPLSLVVKAPGVEHADEYGPDVLIFRLAAEAESLVTLVDDVTVLPEWRWCHASLAVRPMVRLLQRFEAGVSLAGTDDPDVVELLAAVTPAVRRPGMPPAWLARVREQLDDEDGATRVGAIASGAGVHPVYLARCFRAWYGTSVAGYLGRARLQRAMGCLQRSDLTLSRVAHLAGFSDQAHFGNRFREATGLNPGRFRMLINALVGRGATPISAA